jgi:hypothetical protein
MEHLPYAGRDTTCVCVSLIELPIQILMGWVPVLEHMLLSACGLLWPCFINVR